LRSKRRQPESSNNDFQFFGDPKEKFGLDIERKVTLQPTEMLLFGSGGSLPDFKYSCVAEMTVRMGVVQVRENNVPKGQEPLHWILYTDEPIQSFEDGWRALGRYEKRLIIEDYHKAAKTGAEIENRLYRKNLGDCMSLQTQPPTVCRSTIF
jgi:hypothetical protein